MVVSVRSVVRCDGRVLLERAWRQISRDVMEPVRRVLVIGPVGDEVPARQHKRCEYVEQERDGGAPRSAAAVRVTIEALRALTLNAL